MPKWRLFYHVVWATKGWAPLIDEVTERAVRMSVKSTCRAEKAILHAIGMMPDHVYLAASIPPSISLAM